MKALFTKPKFYFLAIVPLLLATAIIKVDCPTCGGHGLVVGSSHMDAVRIISVEDRILDSTQDACTGYIVTKARPYITANNIGANDAEGWLTISLINTDNNECLAERHVPITIAATTSTVLNSLVVFAFYSADIPPKHLTLKVEALTGELPCPMCNGGGKTSLNTSFLANAVEAHVNTEIQSAVEFGPDLSHGEPGSKEWMDWWELS